MSRLLLPRPWVQQPQVPVGINFGNPIVSGLVGGFGFPTNTLHGRPITSGLGRGIDTYSAFINSTSTNVATLPTLKSPRTSAATVIILAKRSGAQPDSGFGTTFYLSKISGVQDPFIHFIKDSGERIRWNTTSDDSTDNSWETTENWPIGVWQVGAYVFSSGAEPAAYRNGRLLTLSVSGGTLIGNLKESNDAQVNLAALRFNGSLACALVFARALSPNEIKSLSDNIWQVFAPLQRRIWVPGVSGGPTYTLTVDSASVPITTTAVGLSFNRALAVSAADVPIALTDVGLNFNRTLAVGSASVPISLADVGLNFNRALSVESATVPISLSDVTLTYTPASGATYTLTVDPATVPVTLTDVGALFNRALAVDTASILIDLKDVTLTFGAASNFTQEELDEILAYVEANLTIPTVEEISQAVWAYVTRSLTAQGNTDIAAGILTAAQATPIHSDVRKVVGITVDGAGTEGDPWGPA